MPTANTTVMDVYKGNPPPAQGAAVMTEEEQNRVNFVRDRFTYMSLSKTVLNSKFQLEKQIYEIFEQHLTQGEIWNSPYRFPEIFGSIQRKAVELIQNLPTCKVYATRDKAKDFAIALQSTINLTEQMSFAIREKTRGIYDTLFYGTGILFEGYARIDRKITPVSGDDLMLKKGDEQLITLYDGLTSERIDPRDFFIDETATVFYDETNTQGARDCVRRRIYPYSTFLEKFKDFKNIQYVVPVAWGSDPWGLPKQPYEKETQEQKTVGKYVFVHEYWNVEEDMVMMAANGIEIYYGANPFKHKRLPFVLYYNYRRDDSCWGISEIEINAPFVYAEEELVNLMIYDAKLALQPALAVSGDVMFNSEEEELQPGSIFTLRGLNGGSVKDAIMPLRFGGVSEDSLKVRQLIEDKRIVATGDDVRALYSNPSQLATQTLSKRETAQKRLQSNIVQNTIESERNRLQMKISNIVQFYAKPYLDVNGKVSYRRIKVSGYTIHQNNDESKPEFKQMYGASGYFSLNEETLGDPNDVEIEVIDNQLKEAIKENEIDDLNRFLESITSLLKAKPEIIQGMDVLGIVKQIAKKMNLDYDDIFPSPISEEGEDTVDLELKLVMLGQVPDLDPNQDPMKALERYSKFMETDIFKDSKKNIQQTLLQLIQQTTEYVPQYMQAKLQSLRQYNAQSDNGLQPMAGIGSPIGQQPGQGIPEVPGGNIPTGIPPSTQQATPSVSAPGGVSKRLGFINPPPTQSNPQ